MLSLLNEERDEFNFIHEDIHVSSPLLQQLTTIHRSGGG